MVMTRQDAIEDGLARLKGTGFTMAPGFAEHGPMVAEAISSLGFNDRIAGWVDGYNAQRRHLPLPPPQRPIDGADDSDWRAALGVYPRAADWLAFFRRALVETPWQEVLLLWVPRLLDGHAGGLTHGLIRTAHAIRCLPSTGVPSDLTRDELAHGLGYWAASYHVSPGDPTRSGSADLDAALARLPRSENADIAPAIESLAPVADIDAAISRHTATLARLLLAHDELAPIPAIQLIHAITAPRSMRDLLPFLPAESGPRAYRLLWRVSAGIVARLARPLAAGSESDAPRLEASMTPAELADRAVAHGDEHAIKLTEAVLHEDRLHPDPVYRVLAEAMLRRLPAF
ncbi:MAG TPA: questin oxidase family protein [Stellaceae bacterium]|nr:questin oxidase family protein [Stellaceae bacterium]